MDVIFEKFIRKPFAVEAIQITEDNIEEMAQFIGKIRKRPDGSPYIFVDRRFIPGIEKVYPGFWMTRIGDNTRCYSNRIFQDQFTPSTPEAEAWLAIFNDTEKKEEVIDADDSSA